MTRLTFLSLLVAALSHPGAAQLHLAARPFVYQGAGFSLTLPAGSEVRGGAGCPGTLLVQPAPPTPGTGNRTLLELCVQTHPNASRLPLRSWVDSVRVERNRTLDPDLAQLEPPKAERFGKVAGLTLYPFCGDCDDREVYLAVDGAVVEIEFHLGIDLVGPWPAQERRHRAVLATFRRTP